MLIIVKYLQVRPPRPVAPSKLSLAAAANSPSSHPALPALQPLSPNSIYVTKQDFTSHVHDTISFLEGQTAEVSKHDLFWHKSIWLPWNGCGI